MANEKLTPATGRLLKGVAGIFTNPRGRYVIKTSAVSEKTGKLRKGTCTLPEGATEADALKALADTKAQLRLGADATVKPTVSIPSLRDYAPLWAERRLARGNWNANGATAEIAGWRLDKYVMPILGDHRLDRITYADIQGWLDGMNRQDLAVNTIKATYGHLRCVVKDGRRDHGLPPLPAFPEPPRASRVTIDALTWENFESAHGAALTREQLGRFLAVAKELSPVGWYPLCVLGFGSDARFSELAAVQVQDLDLTPEVGVWLCRRHLITARSESAPGIKWNRRGVVRLLDAETTRLLRPFLQGKRPEDLLFPSDQVAFHFRSNAGCNLFIKQAAMAAKIPTTGLSSKVFRRTFITLSHLSTMADALTQAQAGHTDPKTTATYIKPTLEHRREHARKMAGVLYVVGADEDSPCG